MILEYYVGFVIVCISIKQPFWLIGGLNYTISYIEVFPDLKIELC